MDRLEINKKKFCRLCLSETVISHSLLNDDNAVFLEALTAIKIDEDEPFPTIACVKCCCNLKFAFQIQQNILEADRKLHMLEEINIDELDIKNRLVDNVVEVEEKVQSVGECIVDHDYGLSSTEPSTPLSRNSPKSTLSELETEELKIGVQCEAVKSELKSDEDNSVDNLFVTETETEEPVLFANFLSAEANTDDCEKVPCKICGQEFLDKDMLDHVQFHYFSTIKCDECNMNCANIHTYREHLADAHKDYPASERPHICDICGKSFLTFYNLNKHKKMTHQKLRPFECEQCQRKFSSKFALRTHERQHTQDMPFTCNICGQSFRQKVSLKGHRKTVHNIEEPLTCACEVCGKWFSSKFAVMSHMRLH
uniref:Gastrula zinc finger protein XlCGF52.1-like n=1 Tax=Diabrotica virgifera virgifera TaxID=50390 RepID=A0A6P7F2K6_DIAVI